MRRKLAAALVLGTFVAGLRTPGLTWWAFAILVAGASAVAWRIASCAHAGPLALLPRTTAIDGRLLPPRWHCDACDKTWAADLSRDQTPVRRFSGYDESKAVLSAQRAVDLVDRRRALAVERSGSTAVPARHGVGVVSIRRNRRTAG